MLEVENSTQQPGPIYHWTPQGGRASIGILRIVISIAQPDPPLFGRYHGCDPVCGCMATGYLRNPPVTDTIPGTTLTNRHNASLHIAHAYAMEHAQTTNTQHRWHLNQHAAVCTSTPTESHSQTSCTHRHRRWLGNRRHTPINPTLATPTRNHTSAQMYTVHTYNNPQPYSVNHAEQAARIAAGHSTQCSPNAVRETPVGHSVKRRHNNPTRGRACNTTQHTKPSINHQLPGGPNKPT